MHRDDLLRFRGFLRNLMMHAAVGTALGGVTTMVGEPQNLLIAEEAGWEFVEFAVMHGADHRYRCSLSACRPVCSWS